MTNHTQYCASLPSCNHLTFNLPYTHLNPDYIIQVAISSYFEVAIKWYLFCIYSELLEFLIWGNLFCKYTAQGSWTCSIHPLCNCAAVCLFQGAEDLTLNLPFLVQWLLSGNLWHIVSVASGYHQECLGSSEINGQWWQLHLVAITWKIHVELISTWYTLVSARSDWIPDLPLHESSCWKLL